MHLFFEYDSDGDMMTFHSSPRVREAAMQKAELLSFQQQCQPFIDRQKTLNSLDDPVLYYVQSARLNQEFCTFLQAHMNFIQKVPVIQTAVRNQCWNLLEIFDSNRQHMPDQMAKDTLQSLQRLIVFLN